MIYPCISDNFQGSKHSINHLLHHVGIEYIHFTSSQPGFGSEVVDVIDHLLRRVSDDVFFKQLLIKPSGREHYVLVTLRLVMFNNGLLLEYELPSYLVRHVVHLKRLFIHIISIYDLLTDVTARDFYTDPSSRGRISYHCLLLWTGEV